MSYDTQADRNSGGSFRTSAVMAPEVKIERTVTFDTASVQKILAAFCNERYGYNIKPEDVKVQITAPYDDRFNYSPGSAKYTVTVKE